MPRLGPRPPASTWRRTLADDGAGLEDQVGSCLSLVTSDWVREMKASDVGERPADLACLALLHHALAGALATYLIAVPTSCNWPT